MQDTRWDHRPKVTGEGKRLVGHAGAVLLRKLADQAGLTASLGSALARKGKFPLVDRGVALVSMAIALGATSMADITNLALEGRVPSLLAAPVSHARTRLTSHPVAATRKGAHAGAVGAVPPRHIGQRRHPPGNQPARQTRRKPTQHDQ